MQITELNSDRVLILHAYSVSFTLFLLCSHEEDKGVPDEDEEEEEEEEYCGIPGRKKPDARSALQMMGYTLAGEGDGR